MKRLLLFAIVVVLLLAGCAAKPVATTTTPAVTFSPYQSEYLIVAEYPNVFWCDPDYYPIGRPGQEQQNALDQFPKIQANGAEFTAILDHLQLENKPTYTDEEKLLVYRQYKLLTYAVQMTSSGTGYTFVLRVGEGQGERIQGTITSGGQITIQKREASFNTCPICLAKGTLIDTPAGLMPVEDIRTGTLVWTTDKAGNRVAEPVLETRATPVPDSFQIVSLALADGRSVTASPGHPTPDGRTVGELRAGDTIDGSVVVKADLVDYRGGRTYDILPAGGTGLYWANGILLKSTMASP